MLEWLKNHTQWVRQFLFGAALIAVYKTFDSLSVVWAGITHIFKAIGPFILAFAIAYMLNIPIKKLNNIIRDKSKNKFLSKHSNGISITTVYIIFLLAIVLIISSIIPAITKDLIDMYGNIPEYSAKIVDFINNYEPAKKLGLDADVLANQFSGIVEKLITIDVVGYTKTLANGIMSFTSGMVNVFIALIASVYMLIDKERILRGIKKIGALFNSNGKADSFILHWSRINEIFTQYIYSRLTSCVIMCIASTILLMLMGEKYAILLGIFIGFMDIIPYFGSIISWVVSLLVMLISGGLSHALWCSALMLVLQQIDGNLLGPKVTGNRLEIRPLVVIIAVSVGGSLFGFAGMLISVPVVAIIRAVLVEMLNAKLEKDNLADKVE